MSQWTRMEARSRLLGAQVTFCFSRRKRRSEFLYIQGRSPPKDDPLRDYKPKSRFVVAVVVCFNLLPFTGLKFSQNHLYRTQNGGHPLGLKFTHIRARGSVQENGSCWLLGPPQGRFCASLVLVISSSAHPSCLHHYLPLCLKLLHDAVVEAKGQDPQEQTMVHLFAQAVSRPSPHSTMPALRQWSTEVRRTP